MYMGWGMCYGNYFLIFIYLFKHYLYDFNIINNIIINIIINKNNKIMNLWLTAPKGATPVN